MEKELTLFAKTLLQGDFEAFEKLLLEFEKTDKKIFAMRHKKMFEKSDFDIESYDDFDEVIILLCYSRQVKRMFFVDWSGEEYPGQIKRSITLMLKNYGQDNFKWNQKKFDAAYLNEIKRGEYVPLVLSEMDKELAKSGYQIAIFNDYSDTYTYCVLTSEDMKTLNGISTERYAVIDTKIYAVYLTDKGTENGKVLLYLKNKFSIPLNEIKIFAAQPEILLVKGDLLTVTREKEEVEKIGCKARIEIMR